MDEHIRFMSIAPSGVPSQLIKKLGKTFLSDSNQTPATLKTQYTKKEEKDAPWHSKVNEISI